MAFHPTVKDALPQPSDIGRMTLGKTRIRDFGSDILRDVMLQLLQPDTLDDVLQSRKAKIDELYRKKILFRYQYDLLTEVPPQPEKFDSHLLTTLLIHICPGVPSPIRGWSQMPEQTDYSLGADIVRLRCMRNKLFVADRPAGSSLNKIWPEIEKVLVRISQHGSEILDTIPKTSVIEKFKEEQESIQIGEDAALKLIDATAEEEKRCMLVSRDVALELIDDTAMEKKRCMKIGEDAALKLIDATAEEEKRCMLVSRDVALELIDDTAMEKKRCMKECLLMEEQYHLTSELYQLLNIVNDFGTYVLRDVMFKQLHPYTLDDVLLLRKSKLDALYSQKMLFSYEYDLLTEVPSHPEKFDVHLLTTLLIHICPGVPAPMRGWFQNPDPTDYNLGADIMRLRYMRSELLHTYDTVVTRASLGELTTEINTVLGRISEPYFQNVPIKIEAGKARLSSELSPQQTREGFLDLLETTPDIDMFSHWEDIVPKMEPFEMGESIDLMRQIWFIQYKWEDMKEDFTQLLNDVPDILEHTTWNDVKQRVKEDPRYMMISEIMADEVDEANYCGHSSTREYWFNEYTRNLDRHRAILSQMNEMKKEVDSLYPTGESWAAYLAADNDGENVKLDRKRVFVVELPVETKTHIEQDKPKLVKDTELLFRCPKDRSNEFNICINRTIESKLSEEVTEKRIIATIRKNSELLHGKYSKLSEIRLSKVKSSGFGTGCANLEDKYCIALVVPYKGLIPVNERPFPRTINGYPTDVWEGEDLPFYDTSSHQCFQPLCQGASFEIQHRTIKRYDQHNAPQYNYLGQLLTIGPFLQHRSRTYILTVAHGTLDRGLLKKTKFYATDNLANEETRCFQPKEDSRKSNCFGNVVRRCLDWCNRDRSDAALIEITNLAMVPTTGDFPDKLDLLFNGSPMRFASGRLINRTDAPVSTPKDGTKKFVIKYGATTGLTKGYIVNTGITYFSNLFEVKNIQEAPFCLEGDSGALVLLVEENDNCEVHGNADRRGHCSCNVGALGMVSSGNESTTKCVYISDSLEKLRLKDINACVAFNDQDSVPVWK